MPEQVEPMLATNARALPADDAEWGYEMDWGGRRVTTYVSGGRVRISGAGGEDLTSWFPEIRELGPALAPTEAVLDGEIVAFDGVHPSPGLLEKLPEPKRRRTPIQFLVYDLLWLEGHATLEVVPYAGRRELLDGLAVTGDHWQTPPYFPGGGQYALQAARDQGLAGVIAKRLDSPYVPGKRTRRWLKIAA
jgi:bifunctional non-homologous end joining protein LigD